MTRRQSGQAIETSGPPESEAGGILSIDLAALDHATLRMGPALSPNGTE